MANKALPYLEDNSIITADQYPVAELADSPITTSAMVGIISAQDMFPFYYNGTNLDQLNATLNILTVNKYSN